MLKQTGLRDNTTRLHLYVIGLFNILHFTFSVISPCDSYLTFAAKKL